MPEGLRALLACLWAITAGPTCAQPDLPLSRMQPQNLAQLNGVLADDQSVACTCARVPRPRGPFMLEGLGNTWLPQGTGSLRQVCC